LPQQCSCYSQSSSQNQPNQSNLKQAWLQNINSSK